MQCPIAIVGLSAELPSGEYSKDNLDYHSFYDFLINKGQSYERIPSERFNIAAWKGTARGQVLPERASFIKGIDKFDNLEFGVSAKDARAMSPATRKLLEQSFLALLDSGIDYRGKNVGCYTSGTAYTIYDVSEPDVFDAEGSSAGYLSMVANRVSYHLNLRGPSIPTDTACCSSLAALHLAIQGLQSGDCEAAVVAGSQMNHRFFDFIQYSQAGILSPDGKCKPFDALADGFARSEGTVAIVVKPLSAAIADNDRVYATILGSSINSSGSDLPPAAPNPDAQSSVMKVAFAKANRKPQDVDYVELHGTGTARGDPTEANWVGKEFTRERDLIVGSVKGNIGHMEICAFLASLCKVCAILEHGIIPPNVNLISPNPLIEWDTYRLRVPLSPTELVPRSEKPLMSIASSGIGGVNGHVVIEGVPSQMFEGMRTATNHALFMVGGLTPTSSVEISNDLQHFIREQEESSLPVVSTIFGRRVKQMTWRSFAVYNHNEGQAMKFSIPQMIPRKSPPIIFVFSGQGPQYLRMGYELFKAFPSFKNNILVLDQIFFENTKTSLIRDYGLFDESQGTTEMNQVLCGQWPISVTLPALTIVQIAYFDLLSEFGVQPDIVLGHSAGETAVLYASGAGSKALAIQLAIARGTAFATMENGGASMTALGVGADKATELLMKSCAMRSGDIADIACYNAPDAVVLSGSVCALDRVEELAAKDKIFYRRLRTSIPVHSCLLEHCKDVYEDAVVKVFDQHPGSHTPSVPTYSTLTGERYCESYDSQYFWENSRKPVQFAKAIKDISERSDIPPVFIEISPHPVLAGYISAISPSACALPVAQRPGKDGTPKEVSRLLTTLGELTVAGCNSVNFSSLNGAGCFEKKVIVPTYPFARKQFPLYPDTEAVSHQFIQPNGPLNRKSLRIGQGTHLSLEQHIIRGEPIMPAAGYLEMAIEFGKTCLYNVTFNNMLSLSRGKPLEVAVELIESKWRVKTLSHFMTLGSPSFVVHAEGIATSELPQERVSIVEFYSYTKNHVCINGLDLYTSLEYFAQYGPQYKRVEKLYVGDDDALAYIRGHTDDLNLGESADYNIHPAILDSAFHATIHENFTGNLDRNTFYLPSGVGHMTWYGKKTSLFTENFYAYIKLSHWSPDIIEYDITLSSESGELVCFLESFSVSRNLIHPIPPIERRFELIYQPTVFPMRINNVSSIRKSLDELSTQSADLFLTLDSLEVPSSEFTRKHSMWRPYLDRLGSKISLSDKVPSKSLVPQDDLVLILKQLLACVVRKSGIQVLRVVSISPRHHIFDAIIATFGKFPSLFFEYFCDEDPTSTIIKDGPNYSARMCGHLDLSADVDGALGVAAESIDIIITVDGHQTLKNSHLNVISSLNRLLVPTGTLILKEHHNCNASYNLPGAKWYHSHAGSYDTVSHRCAHPSIHEWISGFEHHGFLSCGLYHKSQHPFFFLACYQKQNCVPTERNEPSSSNQVVHHFFNDSNEEHLQTALKQYDANTQLTVILTAIEGMDSASASGFSQALRQEVPAWDILLVIVHPSFSDLLPSDIQESIMPLSNYQKQFYIGECGEITVPRIALFYPEGHASSCQSRDVSSPKEIYFDFGSFRSFFTASKTDTNLDAEVVSIGLTTKVPSSIASAVHEAVYRTTKLSYEEAVHAARCAPSVAISVIAIGLHFFSTSARELKILVTNADIFVGETVAKIYRFLNYDVTTVTSDESAKSLWALRKEKFDYIVSGYDDPDQIQILEAVLRPSASGKLFLWNHRDIGIARVINEDPISVKNALYHGFGRLQAQMKDVIQDSRVTFEIPPALSHSNDVPSLQFHPNKAYLLVGGIGSLGSHIALWMYNRGARYIILTSRSGQNSLRRTENLQAIKIINYLRERKDLIIRLEAVDATDRDGMIALMETLRSNNLSLGGCLLLSAVVNDAAFMTQSPEAYTLAHSAKRGALQTLSSAIDISVLDFLVAFSSVSGMFGIPGQTSYASANSALDYLISAYPNACSIIAPAILNTRLVDGGINTEKHKGKLGGIREWGFTVDRLIACLEDCIVLLQSGKRMKCYIPDLEWSKMNQSLTLTSLTSHLVPQTLMMHSTDSLTMSTTQISRTICGVLGVKVEDIDPSIPLTSYGLDSISAAKLSFELVPFIKISQIQLLADISLNHILERFEKNDLGEKNRDDEDVRRKVQYMHDLVERYSIKYDVPNHSSSKPRRNGLISESECVVIVTGTTGALGAHILAELLHNSSVDRIYAFNRVRKDKKTLSCVHEDAFVSRGLPINLVHDERLVLMECDFEKDNFGIDGCLYNTLLSSVTHIILNAWHVDFVVPLESYESQIATVRLFGKFAVSQLRAPAKLIFVSTIGVYRHPKDTELIPHGPILDASIAIGAGYLESKWVAERILQNAAEEGILETLIIRVGQLSGGKSGYWKTGEWVPSLIKSSLQLGCLPDGNDTIAWLSLDAAAKVIVQCRNAPAGTLNIAHPEPIYWSSIFGHLSLRLKLSLVPYEKWLSLLENVISDQKDATSNYLPALPLIEFFRGRKKAHDGSRKTKDTLGLLPKVATENIPAQFGRLEDFLLDRLTTKDVDRWVEYWVKIGFLPSL